MKQLPSNFDNREALTALIAETFDPVLMQGHRQPSPIHGQVLSEAELAESIQPARYARTRNFYDGAVSRLSPFVRQGIVDRKTLASIALAGGAKPAEKFIQELLWGEFWQHVAEARPSGLWQDAEPYKTGFLASEYASELPQDIVTGTTPNACLNHFIRDLQETGYVHNHARMYLSGVCGALPADPMAGGCGVVSSPFAGWRCGGQQLFVAVGCEHLRQQTLYF